MGIFIRILSKCNIRRVDILKVLVSIGSMQGCCFTRLFKILDKLCEENILNGQDMVAQCGYDNYVSEYYQTFDMVSDEEFKKLIDQADVIICHAGTGTVTSSLKRKKKVILFPRMLKYNEHYDDHQLELCKIFADMGYVLCAMNKKELIECINRIDTFEPKPFVSQKLQINKLIINYIDNGKPE